VRHWAEAEAKAYLQTQGYTILAENYTVRGAEVDLIAQDEDTLVFVEVKQRRSARYGSAAETISAAKIERLRGAALVYIAETYARDDLPLRFDALLIEGSASSFSVTHLRGAF
jgi:putative endonuclease